jgi:hypothetical protein
MDRLFFLCLVLQKEARGRLQIEPGSPACE